MSVAHKPSLRRRLLSSSRHSHDPSASTATTLTPDSSQSAHQQSSPDASQADEPDREQGSLNATLTNPKRALFYRRRANKSSASGTAFISNKSSPRSRTGPSFLSRVVYKVVPCVGADDTPPSPIQQGIDLKGQEMATVSHSQVALRPSADVPPETPHSFLTPIPRSVPPSPTDSEIIVPPPPSAHLLPDDETDGLTSGAVQPPGSTGEPIVRSYTRDSEESDASHLTEEEAEDPSLEEQAEEERLIRNGGTGILMGPDGLPMPLLPPIAPEHAGRKCLVLDLDETLVHSSFKPIPHPDFIVPVEIEYHLHQFHVLKRPGVDAFLREMGQIYEVVVFTASLSKYADPVLDQLDTSRVVAHRLFRESCYSHKGNYVKDLSQLGRPIADTIILDNSPASYIFHPNNAVPVSSWFNDVHDAELTDLIPFLADLTDAPDVREILNPVR
ncbi:hypothetical protein D9758_001858 [Tetrapyrgos nigripes]|uniref:protein-serine/threonine phosphatase n=1 Tax=Tetrapyrgos nigripes TaxID=182062 RepID=A0A8H5GTF3_9AGAR|nr:hypothetical protein D9758_001858 [Tetrapyrgos nigripes]